MSSIHPSNVEPSRLFYYPGDGNLHPSQFSFLSKPTLAEFNSLVFGNLLPNTGLFHGLEYMQEFDALVRWPYNYFLYVGNRLPYGKVISLLGSFNVRHVMSFRPLPAHENVELVKHVERYPSWHYQLMKTLPRTYLVGQATEEKNPIRLLKRIADGDVDPYTTVILNQEVSLPAVDELDGRARIISYENQSVVIQAALRSPGILVLTDSYYPGWKAYVNDKEVKIYRANLLFRAVSLPAGDHVVRFRYEPASFKIGLAISAVTLVLLTVMTLGVLYGRTTRFCVFRFANSKTRTSGTPAKLTDA
jgi:hypothetical protein